MTEKHRLRRRLEGMDRIRQCYNCWAIQSPDDGEWYPYAGILPKRYISKVTSTACPECEEIKQQQFMGAFGRRFR